MLAIIITLAVIAAVSGWVLSSLAVAVARYRLAGIEGRKGE